VGGIGAAKECYWTAGQKAVLTQSVLTVCSLCSAATSVRKNSTVKLGTRLWYENVFYLAQTERRGHNVYTQRMHEVLNFGGGYTYPPPHDHSFKVNKTGNTRIKLTKTCVHVTIVKSKGKSLPRQAEMSQGVPGSLRSRIFLAFRHYKGGRSSAKCTGRL